MAKHEAGAANTPKLRQPDAIPVPQDEDIGGIAKRTKNAASTLLKGEPWLNQEREAAYKSLMQGFLHAPLSELQEWFIDSFNPVLEPGTEKLTMADVSSLNILPYTSQSASTVAGTNIERPVLVFTNFAQYQKFSKGLQGRMGSNGMHLPKEMFLRSPPLDKTGLLVSIADTEFIDHEVRHSIDPEAEKREGYNIILSEAFAYYDKDIIQKTKPEEADKRWTRFAASLNSSDNYENGKPADGHTLTYEQYTELGSAAAQALKHYYEETIRGFPNEKRAHLIVQRSLVRMKTLYELFKTARIKPPAGLTA